MRGEGRGSVWVLPYTFCWHRSVHRRYGPLRHASIDARVKNRERSGYALCIGLLLALEEHDVRLGRVSLRTRESRASMARLPSSVPPNPCTAYARLGDTQGGRARAWTHLVVPPAGALPNPQRAPLVLLCEAVLREVLDKSLGEDDVPARARAVRVSGRESEGEWRTGTRTRRLRA